MNIFRTTPARAFALALTLPFLLLLAGCDVDSVDSTTAVISDNAGTIYNFSGLYLHPDALTSTNGPLPIVYPNEGSSKPSGKLITSLRLLQYGSVLEAFDSANQTWSGSISALQGGTATFGLRGKTTAGTDVEIAGTMTYAAEKSTMNASWIEPAYYGTLYAQASVPPAATNTSPSTVTIKPSSATLVSANPSASFSVEGGTAPYNWSVSNTALGNVSPATGTTVTYTSLKVSGVNIITVRDANNNTDTATATYP